MNESVREDLKIMGASTAAGGSYKNVKIWGDGSVKGDRDRQFMSCAGNVNAHGSLRARDLKVRGNMNLKGELIAEKALFQGRFVTSDVWSTELVSSIILNAVSVRLCRCQAR